MNDKPKTLIIDDEPFNVGYLEQEFEDLVWLDNMIARDWTGQPTWN